MGFSTIGIKPETKKKLNEFKDYLKGEIKIRSDDDLINYLIKSNLKYLEMDYNKKKVKWEREYLELCRKNKPKMSFEEFKQKKITAELKC